MKHILFLFAVLIAIASAERVEHNRCYAEWNDKELTMGNALVERKWTIQQGLLTAVSFRDKLSGTEWLRGAGRQPAPHPGGDLPNEERKLTFTKRTGRLKPVEEDSLIVDLTAAGAKTSFTYRFQIFPQSAGVTLL